MTESLGLLRHRVRHTPCVRHHRERFVWAPRVQERHDDVRTCAELYMYAPRDATSSNSIVALYRFGKLVRHIIRISPEQIADASSDLVRAFEFEKFLNASI